MSSFFLQRVENETQGKELSTGGTEKKDDPGITLPSRGKPTSIVSTRHEGREAQI